MEQIYHIIYEDKKGYRFKAKEQADSKGNALRNFFGSPAGSGSRLVYVVYTIEQDTKKRKAMDVPVTAEYAKKFLDDLSPIEEVPHGK